MISEVTLPDTEVYFGNFSKYGSARNGRVIVLVMGVKPTSAKLVVRDKIVHTADCIQYFLADDSNVIVGSAFEVKQSVAQIKPIALHVSSNKDPLEYVASPVPADSGYTYVFRDAVDNILVVPSAPHRPSLCVDIEDEKL